MMYPHMVYSHMMYSIMYPHMMYSIMCTRQDVLVKMYLHMMYSHMMNHPLIFGIGSTVNVRLLSTKNSHVTKLGRYRVSPNPLTNEVVHLVFGPYSSNIFKRFGVWIVVS